MNLVLLALLCPVFKKGDKCLCSNYRGISLLDISGKLYARVVSNKFWKWRDPRVREQQAGFRDGRSCLDQIFSLRQSLSHLSTYSRPAAVVFIDFAAAFDSVHRPSLWKIMRHEGVPPQIIRAIASLYSDTHSCVRVYNQRSRWFGISSGVRQGCVIAPMLFNFVVDWVLRNALVDHRGIQVDRQLVLSDLDYADDIALLADDTIQASAALTSIARYAARVGLQINVQKTKAMLFHLDHAPISLDGQDVEIVDEFCYLGANISSIDSSSRDIEIRIGKASGAFNALLEPVWVNRRISAKTKLRLFNALVVPVLLYGAEAWSIKIADERLLEAFYTRCLRQILKIPWYAFVSNRDVLARAGCDPLANILRARRLRWAGHVARMAPGRLPRSCLRLKPLPGWRKKAGVNA